MEATFEMAITKMESGTAEVVPHTPAPKLAVDSRAVPGGLGGLGWRKVLERPNQPSANKARWLGTLGLNL